MRTSHVINRIHVQRLLFAAALLGLSLTASAVPASKGSGFDWSGGKTASTATAGLGTGGDFARLSKLPSGGVTTAAAAEFEGLMKMPFKPKDFVPDTATVKSVLTPRNLAKALRGGVVAYVAGEAIAKLVKAACVRGMGGTLVMNPNAEFEECVPGTAPVPSSGFEYSDDQGNFFPTMQGACDAQVARWKSQNAGWNLQFVRLGADVPATRGCYYNIIHPSGENYGETLFSVGRRASSCQAGWYVAPNGTCQQNPPEGVTQWRPVTPTGMEDKIDSALRDPSNVDQVIPAVRELLDKGGQVEVGAPTVSGPTSSPTSTSTTTNVFGGQTTTTTTVSVTNYTYNNSAGQAGTVTAKKTDTATTKNDAGETIGSTVETGAPSPSKEEEDPPVQCDKYPDSLGCAQLDTPEGTIPRENKDISFAAEDRFGSGQCPADVMATFGTLSGRSVKIVDWQTFCGMALPLRGLVMALAAIMAFFIIMPGGVRE